jgi:hypothetical protein
VAAHRADHIRNPIGADITRAIVEDPYSGLRTRVDDKRRNVEVRPAQPLKDRDQIRDNARKTAVRDLGERNVSDIEQAQQNHCVLISEALVLCGDSPCCAKFFAIKKTDRDRCVTDVDRKKQRVHRRKAAQLYAAHDARSNDMTRTFFNH